MPELDDLPFTLPAEYAAYQFGRRQCAREIGQLCDSILIPSGTVNTVNDRMRAALQALTAIVEHCKALDS